MFDNNNLTASRAREPFAAYRDSARAIKNHMWPARARGKPAMWWKRVMRRKDKGGREVVAGQSGTS
jgi:hypothetical protein